MTFKEQCIYWHNYFRTLHQVRKETEATGLTCMTFSIIISDCSQYAIRHWTLVITASKFDHAGVHSSFRMAASSLLTKQ